jgi:hypothetical protein
MNHFAASVFTATPRTLEEMALAGIQVDLDLELDALSAREATPRDLRRALARETDLAIQFEQRRGWNVSVNTVFPCCGVSGGYVCFHFPDPTPEQAQSFTARGKNLSLLLDIVRRLARRTGPLVVRTSPEKLVLVDEDADIEQLELLL